MFSLWAGGGGGAGVAAGILWWLDKKKITLCLMDRDLDPKFSKKI